ARAVVEWGFCQFHRWAAAGVFVSLPPLSPPIIDSILHSKFFTYKKTRPNQGGGGEARCGGPAKTGRSGAARRRELRPAGFLLAANVRSCAFSRPVRASATRSCSRRFDCNRTLSRLPWWSRLRTAS